MCVRVCVALSVWLPRLDIKPKAEIVYTYTCSPTHTHTHLHTGVAKAATIKAELTVGRLNDCRDRRQRQRRLESMPQIWSAHTRTPKHTPTRKTVCKLLCVTLTYRVARWPALLTIQIVFSLWFLFFSFFANLHAKWLGSVLRFKCAPKSRQRLFFAPFICVLNVCSSLSLSQQ